MYHNINCQCYSCQCNRAGSRAGVARARTAAAQKKSEAAPKAAPKPEAQPKAETAPKKEPPPRTKAATLARGHLAAYAAQLECKPTAEGAIIPLEKQRAEGGFTLKRGEAVVPGDGFYMLLWELGVTKANGTANLRLGINDDGTVLSEALRHGFDSGQQVTWLSKGDKLSLQIVGEGEQPDIEVNSARLTVLRMG